VVIWQVPSLIGDAVAVSMVGLLLGPMYPLCMNQAGRIIPRNLLTGSIGWFLSIITRCQMTLIEAFWPLSGWIAGFGQAGSAILPFMTGALASRFGIIVLQPLQVLSIHGSLSI
jgi:hypothetical protein